MFHLLPQDFLNQFQSADNRLQPTSELISHRLKNTNALPQKKSTSNPLLLNIHGLTFAVTDFLSILKASGYNGYRYCKIPFREKNITASGRLFNYCHSTLPLFSEAPLNHRETDR
ncbi:hypothetical protein [Undibacterium oligocarboniphilum]|uniref:Uncharacterized protein n=1 Tax=Undibacterium oligocarboniphilum TaxID=666702 RepID=A0A850QDE1_9BURK|nr:hypothetical protein [Undibacterium oligocarboniphilum]MBC3869646.1 hypothetical protein [Undibacterium oligocarboniphilum]NVO77249.1 hypothetical protein [Undibacterium oligocarboniphilum]